MNIASLQVGMSEVPNHISLNIYLSGCKANKKCDRKECQNPQLHNFNFGCGYIQWKERISELLRKGQGLVSAVALLGGEVFDQDATQLTDLIQYLRKFNLPLVAYTGYSREQIPAEFLSAGIDNICYGHYSKDSYNKEWMCKEQ